MSSAWSSRLSSTSIPGSLESSFSSESGSSSLPLLILLCNSVIGMSSSLKEPSLSLFRNLFSFPYYSPSPSLSSATKSSVRLRSDAYSNLALRRGRLLAGLAAPFTYLYFTKVFCTYSGLPDS